MTRCPDARCGPDPSEVGSAATPCPCIQSGPGTRWPKRFAPCRDPRKRPGTTDLSVGVAFFDQSVLDKLTLLLAWIASIYGISDL